MIVNKVSHGRGSLAFSKRKQSDLIVSAQASLKSTKTQASFFGRHSNSYSPLSSMPASTANGPSNGGPSSSNSSSTDSACASIVHSLMCHRQGGEPESFAKRAIECLVKKLKDKPDELDGLIQAVTLNGSHPTKCATIPRTLDGRLQVAGKKVFPHVIYARIWRFSDIAKSEMKHVAYCQFAFDLKLDNVCVNPYHYERVISPGIDLSLQGFALSAHHGQNHEEGFPFHSHHHPSMNRMYGGIPPQSPNGVLGLDLSTMGCPPSIEQQRQPVRTVVHGAPPRLDDGPQDLRMQPPGRANGYMGNGHGVPPMSPAATEMSNNQMTEFWGVPQTPGMSNQAPMAELRDPMAPFIIAQQHMMEQRRYEDALSKQCPPDYWCTIAYFELDQQVGETFKVRNAYKQVSVDGYSDPGHADRFCLGPLTNVHRTEASDRARLHIGKGISLECHDDFSVSLRVFGNGEEDSYSVFVQSDYLDRLSDRVHRDAVHKIYPHNHLKIFDLRVCYSQMMQQVEQAQALAQAQAAVVTGRSQNLSPVPPMPLGSSAGIGADDLRRLCVLRLSFVKGWGPDYNRKSIKETPCWIEIQINRALQLLDEVLRSAPSSEPRTMTEYS